MGGGVDPFSPRIGRNLFVEKLVLSTCGKTEDFG